MKRKAAAVTRVVIAHVLLGVAGCDAPPLPDASSAANSEVRVAIVGDMRSTNPGVVGRDSGSDTVLHHVVEGLVALREDLTVGPMLAESYSISPDAKSYTFKLRSGLRFHNGEPVLAGDVKWSWVRLLDPKTNFECRPYYDGSVLPRILGIDTPDDHTVVVRLESANTLLLEMMASQQCPVAVLHRSSVDANGKWLKPIGTGPYALTDWRPGRYVLLERSRFHTPRTDTRSGLSGRKDAFIPRIRWIVVNDAAAAKTAMVSGEMDLLGQAPAIMARDLEKSGRVRIVRSPGLTRRALLMGTEDPLLKDVRMRQAIAMAIDLNVANSVLELGHSKPNPSVVLTSSVYYTPAHQRGYEFDPAAARRLLQQAGYRSQPVKIQTTKLYIDFYNLAVMVHSQLKAAGVNAEIEVLEWPALLDRLITGKMQLMSWQFTGRSDVLLDYTNVLGSRKTDPYYQWDDQPVLKQLLTLVAESDSAVRRKTYEAAHAAMLQYVPFVNMHNIIVADAVSKRLVGYESWPGATPRLWGVRFDSAPDRAGASAETRPRD